MEWKPEKERLGSWAEIGVERVEEEDEKVEGRGGRRGGEE